MSREHGQRLAMARYEAEERIKARTRMLAGTDPTAHAQEGSIEIDSQKGESAAIIAQKAAYLMGTCRRTCFHIRYRKTVG